ncbi:MAG: DMT family transporter [Acidobacteria bacterium]|nr:DMT family transporter [Acidobacteriota bacterium]MBI3663169.1 DMT family transporter [Acidobacteriota bacterium]
MSTRFKADLALAFCAAIWGATFLVVQDALRDASVLAFIALRFALGGALMAATFREDLRRLNCAEVRAGVLIGVFLFLGYLFQTNGLRFTTPSKAGFINGTGVVLVPVLLAMFWRKRINVWVWGGAVATFVGLYLLSVPAHSASSGQAHSAGSGQAGAAGWAALNFGDVLVFLAAIIWALHIIFTAKYSPRHSIGALSFLQVATTAVLAAVALPVFHFAGWESYRLEWTGGLVWRLLVTAVGCTALGFSVQVWAQRHTTPTHIAILFTLEPVFAALTSYIVLHERLGPRGLTGGGLILSGILISELLGPAQAAPESPGPVDERDTLHEPAN